MENPNAIVMCIQGEQLQVEELNGNTSCCVLDIYCMSTQQTGLWMPRGALLPTLLAKWIQKVGGVPKGLVVWCECVSMIDVTDLVSQIDPEGRRGP